MFDGDELPVAPRLHPGGADKGELDAELHEALMMCMWCGKYHPTMCPYIDEMSYYPDGKVHTIKLSRRADLEANSFNSPEEALEELSRPTPRRRGRPPKLAPVIDLHDPSSE